MVEEDEVTAEVKVAVVDEVAAGDEVAAAEVVGVCIGMTPYRTFSSGRFR